ncbi:MAG: hypothetical protein KAV82_08825 [Phycisphaerae bacterium]|nr:hypothetical protein [Phycisphaerae bacterium]
MFASATPCLIGWVALACLMVWPGAGEPAFALNEPGMFVAQPATYNSPSGVYAMFVDPGERMGRSSATYRFSKNRKGVWSGEREYTLRVVTVTDQGFVVGIAYRDVPRERDGREMDPTKHFHIIILDASGREILNDVSERPFRAFFNPPKPNAPYAQQILVDPENDRVVVRLVEDEMFGRDGWRIYRLSTGDLLDRFWPEKRMPEPGNARFVIDSQLIPDTPLILAHWYAKGPDYEVKDAGARFTLVNTDGRPVWMFDAPNDYAGLDLYKHAYMGVGPVDYFKKHPAILRIDGRKRFDLRLFVDNQRVTFEIKKEGDGRWIVTEAARGGYMKQEPQVESPVKGMLRYLGEVTLGQTQDALALLGEVGRFTFDEDGNICVLRFQRDVVDLVVGESPKAEHLDAVVGFTVDHQGRLYAVAQGTGAVHVFDETGQFSHLCEPGPTDMPGTVREAFIAVTDGGVIYVQRPKTKVYSPPDEYLRYSTSGEPPEVVTFTPRLATATFGPGWAFQPGTGYRCGFCMFKGDTRLMLVDPPGKVIREIRRRPNGKYFSHVGSFAMGPDGSMAALSSELSGDQRQSELDLFSPTGDPTRTIVLPRARKMFLTVALDGHRAVVVGKEEALVVDATSGQIERYALEQPPTASRKWRAFLAGGGRELLLFDARRYSTGDAAVLRYELPDLSSRK